MDICIDFDGTCVTHEFPKIGKDIGAVPILKKLIKNGHNLILFTMRSDIEKGNYLTRAVEWFDKNGIKLYGVNINPSQHTWTTSPKAYGQLYVDDAALGVPLKYIPTFSTRPFVDWEKVEEILIKNNIL